MEKHKFFEDYSLIKFIIGYGCASGKQMAEAVEALDRLTEHANPMKPDRSNNCLCLTHSITGHFSFIQRLSFRIEPLRITDFNECAHCPKCGRKL